MADRDDFWDLRNLTVRHAPLRSEKQMVTAPPEKEVSTRSATVSSGQQAPTPSVKKGEMAPESTVVRSYTPENSLLDQVKIGRWPSRYSFYEQFYTAARNYVDYCPGESEYLPFFSFMPQYQQMTKRQLDYYCWWRENLRRQNPLQTDICYIQLYIYEILNLPELIPPERGVRELCYLWASYREQFPRLDKYLAEWLCDYCLIHGLPCPRELLEPFLSKILPHASLREFYLSPPGEQTAADALVELNAAYHFRMSKYRTDENRAIFEKHIPAAMNAFLQELGREDPRFLLRRSGEAVTVTRDSFVGAVCAFRNKRSIRVTYRPVVVSGGLSPIITDAVKACENGVRAALGIRARFRVSHLPSAGQAAIDRYFARYLPPLREGRAPVRLPDGSILPEVDERAYEKPSAPMDPAAAWEIEQASRETAMLLGSDEAKEASVEEQTPPPAAPQQAPASSDEGTLLLRGLCFLATGEREAFAALAEGRSMLPATLAERLNEAALDRIGDVIAESPDGKQWIPIEDYREELTQWITELSTTNETN